ncbi:MAG: hypothetical protein K0R71_595 [Bacillales bacterium]|jgi:predicted ATPase|nr:hypothetical protein [Bacillales bacterium]
MDYIKIKNYKCFLDNKINFKKITILAGANSVGKSSVIQTILLLRQAIEKLKKNKTENVTEQFKIILNGIYGLNLGSSDQIFSANGSGSEITFAIPLDNSEMCFRFNVNNDKIYLDFIDSMSELGKKVRNTGRETIFHDYFYYLNAERFGPRSIQEILEMDKIGVGINGENTGYVYDVNFNKNICENRAFIGNESKILLFQKQVEFWLDYITPGVKFKVDKIPDVNLVKMQLNRPAFDTNYSSPYNSGFGISYVLPIIISGLTAVKDSLLVVENPEAHLHPGGQSRIGEFLARIANSGVQVILETHSEHVVNGIKKAALKGLIDTDSILINFFELSKDRDRVALHELTLTRDAELNEWPKGFFDQESDDIRELFRLRKERRTMQ